MRERPGTAQAAGAGHTVSRFSGNRSTFEAKEFHDPRRPKLNVTCPTYLHFSVAKGERVWSVV